ncbi:hypothetical protein [Lacticaseibacillus songhuajiangensis]|jgi:hypothetical protein|uniref:hypothetical protein n=1 Tax=Lacticaseibacillus songhuajiangensis TaxID=1296539 RepID=UPI000F78150D|nr:hypothetical protein [Lacticaseibacillus songhuajiangensis]MCI1283145.1 hypothetical protein [Lacticaseibacillus songhuajiangensis]
MELTSTAVLLRTVDVLEGRATIENVEPGLQAKVAEAVVIYTQGRTLPTIDDGTTDGGEVMTDAEATPEPQA